MPKYAKYNGKVISFPDNFTPDDMAKAIESLGDDKISSVSVPDAGDVFGPKAIANRTKRNVGKLAPYAGGAAGGLVGGIPGATIGGMAGKVAGRLLGGRGEYSSAGAAVRDIGGSGVEQGLLETGGLALQTAGKAVALPLMKGAIKASSSLTKRAAGAASRTAGKRIAPTADLIAKQALAERVGVGGSAKVGAKINEASAQLDIILDDAERNGTRFVADQFLKPVRELRKQISKEADPYPSLLKLGRTVDAFKKAHGGKPLTPRQVRELKKTWQGVADAIYRAEDIGTIPTERQALKGRISGALAKGAKKHLENIPGVIEANAKMSGMIPLKKALEEAELRPASKAPWLPEAANWVIPPALTSAQTSSRAALALTGKVGQSTLRQLPRGAAGTLALSQEDQVPDVNTFLAGVKTRADVSEKLQNLAEQDPTLFKLFATPDNISEIRNRVPYGR